MKQLIPILILVDFFSTIIDCIQSSHQYKNYKFTNNCPTVSYVSSIDLSLIDGGWYQQFATVNGSQAGCDGDCVTLNARVNDESKSSLDYCCNKGGQVHCGPFVGSAVVGQNRNDQQGVLNYNIFGGLDVPCVIVDVDYDIYFSTYKCFYIHGQRIEIGEIWSRDPVMEENLKQKALRKLDDVFGQKNLLIPIKHHDSCPYEFQLLLHDFGEVVSGVQVFEMFDDDE